MATTTIYDNQDQPIEVEAILHRGAAQTHWQPEEPSYFEIENATQNGETIDLTEEQGGKAIEQLWEEHDPE